jgi:hypothetical protein
MGVYFLSVTLIGGSYQKRLFHSNGRRTNSHGFLGPECAKNTPPGQKSFCTSTAIKAVFMGFVKSMRLLLYADSLNRTILSGFAAGTLFAGRHRICLGPGDIGIHFKDGRADIQAESASGTYIRIYFCFHVILLLFSAVPPVFQAQPEV